MTANLSIRESCLGCLLVWRAMVGRISSGVNSSMDSDSAPVKAHRSQTNAHASSMPADVVCTPPPCLPKLPPPLGSGSGLDLPPSPRVGRKNMLHKRSRATPIISKGGTSLDIYV